MPLFSLDDLAEAAALVICLGANIDASIFAGVLAGHTPLV